MSINIGLGQHFPLFTYILFSFFLKENVSPVVQMKSGHFHFKLIIQHDWRRLSRQILFYPPKDQSNVKSNFLDSGTTKMWGKLLDESHNPADKDKRNLKVNLGTLEI